MEHEVSQDECNRNVDNKIDMPSNNTGYKIHVALAKDKTKEST